MNKKKILFFIMMIGMMMLIFFFSSQNGDESSAMSSGVFYKLKESFNIKIDIAIIRKLAHLTEYLFLGVTTLLYVGTFKISDEKSMAIATVICALYASSDEFHQSFIANRDGRFGDVLIDSIGAMIGITITMLILLIIRMKNDKKITI